MRAHRVVETILMAPGDHWTRPGVNRAPARRHAARAGFELSPIPRARCVYTLQAARVAAVICVVVHLQGLKLVRPLVRNAARAAARAVA